MIDEESPGRVEYFDACTANERGFSSAYRPQEAMSTQVGDSMLRALGKIKNGPVTGVKLDSVVSTGDNVDNNQLNETRWFMNLLDGGTVRPDSGASGYDGYTQEQTSQALSDDILELAQKAFDAVGAKGRWYAVLGNHDGLVQGNVPLNDSFQGLTTGGIKAFVDVDEYRDCPTGASDPTTLRKVENAFLCCGRSVAADPKRRFLTHKQVVAEYFKTTGMPDGHGFRQRREDPVHGGTAGYYSFPILNRVDIGPKRSSSAIPEMTRGVVIDTITYDSSSRGTITDPQFGWLEDELKKWSSSYYDENGELVSNSSGRDRLLVLFSHHSSVTLDAAGEDPAGAPYHCFRETDRDNCVGAEGLHDLLQRFPNVVAWVDGHEHNNVIRSYPAPTGQDPARGFWEINTAAHIDWPQQSRIIELAWAPGATRADADSVLIYTTIVDHSAAPDSNPETQSTVQYLASLSRVEAYYDACVRPLQADCAAAGTPEDLNTRLVQKAPFDLGY